MPWHLLAMYTEEARLRGVDRINEKLQAEAEEREQERLEKRKRERGW